MKKYDILLFIDSISDVTIPTSSLFCWHTLKDYENEFSVFIRDDCVLLHAANEIAHSAPNLKINHISYEISNLIKIISDRTVFKTGLNITYVRSIYEITRSTRYDIILFMKAERY